MKYRVLIGFLLSALLLGGCRRETAAPVPPVETQPRLSITLEIPAAPGTKGDEGEAASEIAEENESYDLKIWVFKHDENHTQILYDHLNDLPQAGTVRKYVYSVPRSSPPTIPVLRWMCLCWPILVPSAVRWEMKPTMLRLPVRRLAAIISALPVR